MLELIEVLYIYIASIYPISVEVAHRTHNCGKWGRDPRLIEGTQLALRESETTATLLPRVKTKFVDFFSCLSINHI